VKTIESEVRQIVSEITGLSPEIPADANLYLDLGVASVHALRLLTELEDHFDLRIPDQEFVEAISIDRLVELLKKMTASTPTGFPNA
jgi:acyl carrier protein